MTVQDKELHNARPKLKVVSPLAHWVVFILGWFNILLGISFIFAIDENRFTSSLLIVNNVFTFKLWGILFLIVGLLKLYSLFVNNWDLSRKTLIVGVSIKAAWAIALIVRIFVSPGTLFVTLLWIALALIQIGTFVYFMPPSIGSNQQRRIDREDVE